MGKLYRTNGEVEEISPENGKEFTLEELYRHLNCDTVEIIPMPEDSGLVMIGDENGALHDTAERNETATAIYRDRWGILDPVEHHKQQMKEMEEMYGGAVIIVDSGREPYEIMGDVIICAESMF